jgi:phosphate uptake regulator
MKRRVIKQGHNTLTVTLPSTWNKKHGIKPGDEIEIKDDGNALHILPKKDMHMPPISINLKGLSNGMIWRYVVSTYRNGHEEFEFVFDNPTTKQPYSGLTYHSFFLTSDENKKPLFSPIEIIQMAVNRCIGIEIIDQKENWCLVKELGETNEKEFGNALRRVFHLLLTFSKEIHQSLLNNELGELLKSANLIDNNINRFTDYCLRVLNRKGYEEPRKTATMFTIIFFFELIGDELKKISIHLMSYENKTHNIEGLFATQLEQFERFYNLFYSFSNEKCEQLFEADKQGNARNCEIFHKLSDDEKEILHHLKKIGIFLMSLTELRINLEG